MRRPEVRWLVGEVVTGVRDRAGRSDLMVVAAAMTTYAAFGLVPLLAIGARVAAAAFGPADVVRAGQGIAAFLPGPLHLDRGIVAFSRSAASAPWWTALVALAPASLYAEGTVRSLERFSRTPERRSRTVRGRLLTVVFVLTVVAAVLLLVGAVRPLLFDPFGQGFGPRLLGIVVAFHILFGTALVVLCLVYRLFATTPIRPAALLVAAGGAASWLAGQSLGYLLAVRLVSGFANAYGRYAPVGAVAAISFFVYLLHIVVLLGYTLALRLHEDPIGWRRDTRPGRAAPRQAERQPTDRQPAAAKSTERQPAEG